MTLHIFNPEHDIALAANLDNFTAPHAGRQLRYYLGFLPALWARNGDTVLVDDTEKAERAYKRFAASAKRQLNIVLPSDVTFTSRPLSVSSPVIAVEPWGWDGALFARLHRLSVDEGLLLSREELEQIRQLSHRRTAAQLLSLLQTGETYSAIKAPIECNTMEEVGAAIALCGRAVIKAPWSSSGRGIRFVDCTEGISLLEDVHLSGWLRNVIAQQGCVMIEKYYTKVKDFGMEFEAMADGSIRYSGLSLFNTANGAYTGNILATEQRKRELISRYVTLDCIDNVKEDICCLLPQIIDGRYKGPLGVDMMVINDDGSSLAANEASNGKRILHPCVEINLRRTMGHVALTLSPSDDDLVRVMRVVYDSSHYRIKIQRMK